jgi:hypothetical protein
VVRDVAPVLGRPAGDPAYAREVCLDGHGAEALDRPEAEVVAQLLDYLLRACYELG